MSVFFKASPNYDLQHGVLLSVFFNQESPPLPLLLSLLIIPYYFPLLSNFNQESTPLTRLQPLHRCLGGRDCWLL